MFEIVDIRQNWFSQSVKLKALTDIDYTHDSAQGVAGNYSSRDFAYKVDEVITVKFPFSEMISVGDRIGVETLVSFNRLMPKRYSYNGK